MPLNKKRPSRSVRISNELYAKALERASENGISFSEYVRFLIADDCKKRSPKK